MSDNLNQAKENLKQAGEKTVDAAKDKYKDIKHDAREVKDELEGQASNITSSVQEYCGKVKNYISENPLTALGIAVAVGVGLSAIISNRK